MMNLRKTTETHEKPFFELLSDSQRMEIRKNSVLKNFKKGEIIFMPGDIPSEVYIIKKGTIKTTFVSVEGTEIALPIMRPGALMGISTILDWEARVCVSIAMNDVQLLCIKKNYMLELIKRDIGIALLVINYLGTRLRNSWKIIENLASKNVKERLIRLLYQLKNDFGTKKAEIISIDISLTHEQISQLIGSSRQTTTSLINELEDKKFIRKERKRIIILDQTLFRELD